jgi:DNA helicase IV
MSDPSPLDAERAHLVRARSGLHAMQEQARSLGDVAGDAFSSESLGKSKARRLKELADDGVTPMFFGRLDYASTDETFHIGRRHVLDGATGDPLVVDWRAPISLPFYRATRAEPMDVALRRRFGFAAGVLTSFEDEPLLAGVELGTGSRLLAEEIERPRVGPMRDIVATIQPDQDVIVRAELEQTICVQGAPGTGKTAVGLHRAAYLLYAHRERLRRGVLVVGPNRAFLDYIGQVLPALGEIDVTQETVEDLTARVPVRSVDATHVAVLKGDARLAEVVRRAVYAGLRRSAESLVVPVGERRWRISAGELSALVDRLLGADVRYGAARERLRLSVAEAVRRRIEEAGGAPSDAALARIAASSPLRAYVDELWPAIDPIAVVSRLLSDADFLRRCSTDVLDDAERAALLWKTAPASPRRSRWSMHDSVLVDEASDLVARVPAYVHVVLDEAQDCSPMQLRAVGRRCPLGSATVLGDLAQATTPWSVRTWAEALTQLGKPAGQVTELTRGYRVPQQVLDLANRLLPHLGADVREATSVRRTGTLRIDPGPAGTLTSRVVAAVADALRSEGSVGVIAADAGVPGLLKALRSAGIDAHSAEVPDETSRVALLPSSLAKGLEFDQVVVVEPAAIVAAEPRGLHRLYVVLTRAVSGLTVVHAEPLPPALTAA